MVALWIILIGSTLPLAVHVTKHLTSGGFDAPHSSVQWATAALNQIHAPQTPPTLLVQDLTPALAKNLGATLHIGAHSFHRMGANTTLFVPPPQLLFVQSQQLRHLVSLHHGSTTVVSQSAVSNVVTHDASTTLLQSGLVVIPILVVLLLVVFGSVSAVTLPLIIALSGTELVLACVSIISRYMALSVYLTDIVSFLALGVGVDYALFISTRYRQNLDAGLSVEESIVDSMRHAGRSVFYSGLAVALAVAALMFGGNAYWRGLAIGGAVALFSILLATHTLLPAVLGLFGRHVNWGRIRRPDFRFWKSLSRWVTRHPIWAMVISLSILLPFVALAPQVRMSTPANLATMLPRSSALRQAITKQQALQGAGSIAPIAIAVRLPVPLTHQASWSTVTALQRHLERLPDVASVSSPTNLFASPRDLAMAMRLPGRAPGSLRQGLENFVTFNNPHLVVLYVVAKTGPNDVSTGLLVNRIDTRLTAWLPPGSRAAAGGLVPVLHSFNQTTQQKLPLIIGAALAVALIVLTIATRSVLQALLGVVLNALVALATTGFMVFVAHHQLLGFTRQPLDSSITPLIFVLLFGLSMDYEVILLHRIQEHWHGNHSLQDAVEHGVATTGAMITGAGMIMVVVFLALLISPLQIMKTFGIGLSFAVLADTWIVRSLLVPSITTVFAGASFWPWRSAARRALPNSLP
jgi:RND superfamily putative drug exporter